MYRYGGLYGALLGMSAEGLTTHEANLEETEITFSGFPWLLRLRYIMENAHNSAVCQKGVPFVHLTHDRRLTLSGRPPTIPSASTTWWVLCIRYLSLHRTLRMAPKDHNP